MMSFVDMFDDTLTRLGPTIIVHAQSSKTSNQVIFATRPNKMMSGSIDAVLTGSKVHPDLSTVYLLGHTFDDNDNRQPIMIKGKLKSLSDEVQFTVTKTF